MKLNRFLTLFSFLWLGLASAATAASVTGKVNFTGTAPERAKLDMNADPTCAGAHSGAVLAEDVVVNDNGTLRNVFVYAKEGVSKKYPAPKEPVILDQHGCVYSPHVFGAIVNQPIQIVNSDSTLHNVHALPKQSREFNLGMPIKGMKIKKKVGAPEVLVKFKCDVHPWMSAYGGIVEHPFFSVSGEDGSFEIKDLPPGNYVIAAVHEKHGEKTANVTVDASGATVDFSYSG